MTEGPYKLPEGWRWVRLGEVCEVLMGQSPPSSTYNHDELGLPFFQGKADFGELHPTPRVWCTKPMKIAEAGDILISVRAPVGPTNLAKERCCIGRGLAALRVGHEIQTGWLLFYLRSIEQELGQSGSGSTFNALTKKELSAILIPLPPLAGQRRIVARIEELMGRVREARRLRQEAQKDAERLWQSVLAQTFPRPGSELPEGWRWVRLGEVAKAVNGFGFPKRFQGRSSGPIAFLKVSDLNSAANDPEVTVAANYVDEGIVNALKARAFKPGTIVFPKIGGAIATNKKRKLGILATFDNNIMGLVPHPENILTDYLLQFMYTVDLSELSKTGPVPSIRQSMVEGLQIPLPPLAEQRHIVAHLQAVQERLKALGEAQAATEAELKRLEQAILEKAFRGEL
jgi:type I restriction enzyme S subunit